MFYQCEDLLFALGVNTGFSDVRRGKHHGCMPPSNLPPEEGEASHPVRYVH